MMKTRTAIAFKTKASLEIVARNLEGPKTCGESIEFGRRRLLGAQGDMIVDVAFDVAGEQQL